MKLKQLVSAAFFLLFLLPLCQPVLAATFSLSPPAATITAGATFSVAVAVDAQGQDAVAALATLQYDPALLEYAGIERGDFFPILLPPQEMPAVAARRLEVAGTIDASNTEDGQPRKGKGVLARIKFISRRGGIARLSFVCGMSAEASQIETIGAKDILSDCAAIPAGVYTIKAEAISPPLLTSAPPNQTCDSCGKCTGQPAPADWKQCKQCRSHKGRWTIIGCVPSSPGGFVQTLLRFVFSIVGGLAFLALLYAGGLILTARGNPAQLNQGKALLRNTFIGIFLVLLAVFILRFIGWDLFALPGWGG